MSILTGCSVDLLALKVILPQGSNYLLWPGFVTVLFSCATIKSTQT